MRSTILAFIVLAAAPALAQAQSAPTPPAPPAPPAAAIGQAPTPTANQRANSRVQQHLAVLHKRLAITPAQQPQWEAFALAMRQNATAVEQTYAQHLTTASSTAPESLRNYAAMAHLRAENVDRLIPPFEALYQTMSPEQKTAADRVFQQFNRREQQHQHG